MFGMELENCIEMSKSWEELALLPIMKPKSPILMEAKAWREFSLGADVINAQAQKDLQR